MLGFRIWPIVLSFKRSLRLWWWWLQWPKPRGISGFLSSGIQGIWCLCEHPVLRPGTTQACDLSIILLSSFIDTVGSTSFNPTSPSPSVTLPHPRPAPTSSSHKHPRPSSASPTLADMAAPWAAARGRGLHALRVACGLHPHRRR